MTKAQELFDKAFLPERPPRSTEYRKGVWDALNFRIHGIKIACPWPEGTVMFDAYFAGVDEGHFRWRHYNDDEADGREE